MLWTILSIAKWIAVLLVLLNLRSFPLAWNVRTLSPWFKFKFEEWLHQKRLPSDPVQRKKAHAEWWKTRSPVGRVPFEVVLYRPGYVSVDETDYNLHLSNSCYAKALDDTRMKWAIQFCPQFLSKTIGGNIPLAATSFVFQKEIPVFATYEIRLNIATWGDKWIYLLGKFVSKTKRKTSKKMVMPIGTPADATMPGTPTKTQEGRSSGLDALASKLAATPEADGAKVYCVSVAQMCFKIGRITIPPALVLTLSGLNARANPQAYERLVGMGDGLKAFLTGGWKDEEEKWWEGGWEDVESIRKERLDVIGGVQTSMGSAAGW
ncbi:hypothetical protein CYLTODRAFT_208692 [Cylindrobasidium torrendii FP15055 ss-10]|uniref:Thioesterase/thiol ester dehydrase-isomerase n=1 Tax=Cylindrobasidium torrendii FP15055 ss-10 TaxID=1314674 RepID=A0A0D7BHG9_9AGAR|nr:hypothetical protein CYLTODRAFT_208692 [Cylindrobasidium torrendii FP15055 ss-10]